MGKPPFDPVIRELPITNTFSFTMIIYDAAFPPEAQGVFSVSKVLITMVPVCLSILLCVCVCVCVCVCGVFGRNFHQTMW